MFYRIKLENARIYKKNNFFEMKSEVITEYTKPEKANRSYFSVAENIEKAATVDCILRYSLYQRVPALNFANAMFP